MQDGKKKMNKTIGEGDFFLKKRIPFTHSQMAHL